MARSTASPSIIQSRIFTLLGGVVIVAALYFGREILLPFAIAVLLSFVLAPLADWLERYRVPRVPSVVLVVGAALLAFLGLSFVLVQQLYDLAYDLPQHRERIIAKLEVLQGSGGGVVERVTATIEEVSERLAPPEEGAAPPADGAPEQDGGDAKPKKPEPVPVEVVQQLTARDVAAGVLGPLIGPIVKTALVTIFVIFMLLEREDLRSRVIHLVGSRQLNLTTKALDDAAGRVSRYLLMQLVINVTYGVVITIGLYFIGLPNALLWGSFTAVVRFIPFVGPWIGAAMPIILSLAVFDGWMQPLMVAALFIANELISNNVLEPWLYGASTGISTFGIVVSAAFWTWLWGPVGLLLATPLTVCLTVMGRYVPQFSFLTALISDEQMFPPASRVYQRLLALDPEEALEIAEDYLDENSLEDLYDLVLVPALSLAEQDRHRGDLDEHKQRLILDTMREMVDDLAARVRPIGAVARTEPSEPPLAGTITLKRSVTCLAARDEADEIVGQMLGHLLADRGIETQILSASNLVGERVEQIGEQPATVVCISALPPQAATHARYLAKRLRPRFPRLKIVVGLWQSGARTTKRAEDRLMAVGVDRVSNTLSAAAEHLERTVASEQLITHGA